MKPQLAVMITNLEYYNAVLYIQYNVSLLRVVRPRQYTLSKSYQFIYINLAYFLGTISITPRLGK